MKKAWVVAVVLFCGVVAALFAIDAQRRERIPRIGFLGLGSQGNDPLIAAFQDGLHALGYVDGRNIIIEYRWAEARFDRLPALASELVALNVDVIVTASSPAVRAAQRATTTIPIVMLMHDPVEEGFAASLARPGGNITGISFQATELAIKRLDLLRQAVPNLTRVAVVWNKEGGRVNAVEAVETAARARKMQVLALELREPGEFAALMASAKAWGAQGVVQLPSPFLNRHRAILLESLKTNQLPATCELREFVVDGCLMTYSANFVAIFHRLPHFVDRVLKGANPADIAIEQPREFEFVVNVKTAEALGLSLPSSLLVLATEVIR